MTRAILVTVAFLCANSWALSCKSRGARVVARCEVTGCPEGFVTRRQLVGNFCNSVGVVETDWGSERPERKFLERLMSERASEGASLDGLFELAFDPLWLDPVFAATIQPDPEKRRALMQSELKSLSVPEGATLASLREAAERKARNERWAEQASKWGYVVFLLFLAALSFVPRRLVANRWARAALVVGPFALLWISERGLRYWTYPEWHFACVLALAIVGGTAIVRSARAGWRRVFRRA